MQELCKPQNIIHTLTPFSFSRRAMFHLLFSHFILLIYNGLYCDFFFSLLVFGVFDPGQPGMDVGFLLFHSYGKYVPPLFFFFFINQQFFSLRFAYLLFIFGCAGSSLLRGLSLVEVGRSSLLWCMGISLQWLLLLESTSSVGLVPSLFAPHHVESHIRDRTCVPCTGR